MAWDTSLARSVRFTVAVSGVVRPHVPGSITWAQDITSDLPAAVTAGGAVAHRTGTIEWARQQPVETRTPSPWYKGGYWIPEVGEPVTVDAHDGAGNTVRVFTGVIDTVEGDAFGNRSSQIVATLRGGNQVVRKGALTRLGSPVAAPDGNDKPRRQATTAVWTAHGIARDLGYHAVPPPPADSKVILDATLQGATYTRDHDGGKNAKLVVSHRAGYDTLDPVWSWGPDGFGISNALLEWVPNTGGGTGAGALGLSLVVYQGHTEDVLVRVRHGADADCYLRVTGDGWVRVATFRDAFTTTHTIPTKIPTGPGPHRVSAVFRGGKISLRVAGAEHTVDAPTPTLAVSRIRLEAGARSSVAGVQAWHPSSLTDHHARGWVPSAAFRYGTGTHSIVLTPSIRDRKARDVLEDYAAALLSPLWVDGHGVLQVVTGRGLHEQAVSVTVDALTDVSDMSYSMAMLDHRPTVEVTYAHAHHTNASATNAKTVVWQGNGSNIDSGETDETFIEVPDDEEWIEYQTPAIMEQVTLDNRGRFQTGAGSWWGFAWDSDVSDYTTQGSESPTSILVETLSPWAWKVSTTIPAGINVGAVLQTANSSLFRPAYREFDLPVIRAKSRVRYEDRTVAATSAGANQVDGILTHDAGKWVTTTSAANDLATWVHSMVATPTPILENLVVRFNPELDVGVKATIRAQDVFGVDFQALILSVDHRPGDDTTMVTARVTKVTAYKETIDDVDYAHIGQSLVYWENVRTGMTLDEVTAAPYIL